MSERDWWRVDRRIDGGWIDWKNARFLSVEGDFIPDEKSNDRGLEKSAWLGFIEEKKKKLRFRDIDSDLTDTIRQLHIVSICRLQPDFSIVEHATYELQ